MAAGAARRRWLPALAALPFAGVLAFVLALGVDIPYFDQWMFLPVIQSAFEGSLTWPALWEQHNEHRLLLPRLLMVGLALLTDWNTRAEMVVSVGFTVLLYLGLLHVVRQARDRLGLPPSPAFVLLAAAFVCSLSQFENWLWGWQFVIPMSLAALVWALALLAEAARTRDLALPTLLGVASSLSFATGLATWPLGLVVLAANRRPDERRLLALWALASVATITAYFATYTRSGWQQGPDALLAQARELALFVLVFLGSPLTGGNATGAIFAGSIGLVGFAALAVWVVAGRRTPLLPIALLGLLAIASALAASTARIHGGAVYGGVSRYVTFAQLLWISDLALLGAGASLLRRRRPRLAAVLGAALPAAAACLLLASQPRSYRGAVAFSSFLSGAREAVLTGQGYDAKLIELLHPKGIGSGTGREFLLRHRLSLFRGADGDRAVAELWPKLVLRCAVERGGDRTELVLAVSRGLPGRFYSLYALAPGPAVWPLWQASLDGSGAAVVRVPLPGPIDASVSFLALSLNRFDALIVSDPCRAVFE
jgi:hypothetical protein